jgi:hypothetical protein
LSTRAVSPAPHGLEQVEQWIAIAAHERAEELDVQWLKL